MLWISSLFPISILSLLFFPMLFYNNSHPLPNDLRSNKSSFFGCDKLGNFIRCDLQKNEIIGTDIPQKSNQIVNVTRDPIYVNGTSGKAIELKDSYRDYVEIPQKDIYNSSKFSISFWVKKQNGTSQSSPHSHIISHTTRDHKKGWFFETNRPLVINQLVLLFQIHLEICPFLGKYLYQIHHSLK